MIPQPITLQGRTGTIVYMDAFWHPVTPEQATMAKVVFDDGGVAFYFTESDARKRDYVRDDKGRFAETGWESRTFLHGTSQARLTSILKQGLLTEKAGEVWPGFSQQNTVYLTTDESDAERWAISAARKEAQKTGIDTNAINLAILKIRIPEDQVGKILHDTHFKHQGSPARQFTGSIPPEWIVGAKIGYPSEDIWEDTSWKDVPLKKAAADGQIIYVALVLQSDAPAEGVGGITRKFDAAAHPRGEDGRFIEASQPRIFNRPEELARSESWYGEQGRWTWKDPETGKPSGRLLTGEPIPREKLPETLYHVTTNAPAVESSGVLLGLLESGGLGGGQAQGVSFTSDPQDAVVIQRELRRAVQIARGDITIEDIPRFAREDEQSAGLTEGALKDAVTYAVESSYRANEFTLKNTFVWDEKLPEDQRGYVGPPHPPEEYERLRRGLMKDAFNAYLQVRGHSDVPLLKNPILFGRQEQLAKLKPEYIQTLEIPSAQIPEGALVTTGSDKFLHEVRAYSDVPLWKKLQSIAKKDTAFDEAKHPRDPAGTPEGGQFTSSGQVGEPIPDPALAEQAKAGITAVERLLPEAVKLAEYKGIAAPESWEEIDSDLKVKVRQAWKTEQYDNGVDVDTSELDKEFKSEIQKNNQDILDAAEEETLKVLKTREHTQEYQHGEEFAFQDTAPALPVDPPFSLQRQLDPDTIDYGEGEHLGGVLASAREFGAVKLDLEALRFTSGEPLNTEEQQLVKRVWDVAYGDAYQQAVDDALQSNAYNERRDKLESEYVDQMWRNLDDDAKYDFMVARKIAESRSLKPGEPNHWMTGVEEGVHQDEDYARTHAIALKLTELRTNELRKERGLLDPMKKPTFTVRHGIGAQSNFVVEDEFGRVVGASNTPEQAKANAEEWATHLAEMTAKLETSSLVERVWQQWKTSSSEGLSLSMQLAAAKELGGVHRLTPDEVREAQGAARESVGGIETLQAYVRAQWEVTQMVMAKAEANKVQVYRGLMLDQNVVAMTANEEVDPIGETIRSHAKVEHVKVTTIPNKASTIVAFDYDGQHFVTTKERVAPASILEVGKTDWESDESAIQRRIEVYLQDQRRKRGDREGYTRLPELQLLRGGAQSTTGTQSVANDWAGVGNVPSNAVRVVLRIEAPPTSVLSLPVYGKNIQEEHESVLLGTKDRWAWDAWRNQAPTFKIRPVVVRVQKAETTRLIIDLQEEDRNKPHWMSGVDWTAVQSVAKREYVRQPAGSEHGGEFASTRQGARAVLMDVIGDGPVGVDDHPVAIKAAYETATVLREMKDKGYTMPPEVDIRVQTRKAPSGAVEERGVLTIKVPDHLPPEMSLDDAYAIAYGGSVAVVEDGKLLGEIPKFAGKTFRDLVIHEMGHINRTYEKMVEYIPRLKNRAEATASAKAFTEEMQAIKKFEHAAKTSVSNYAATNPDEFVAEVFTILYNGGTLPQETADIYHALRGAKIR